jgi:hypothetical protein
MVKNGSFQPVFKNILNPLFFFIINLLIWEFICAAVDLKKRDAKIADTNQESKELRLVANISRNLGGSILQFRDLEAAEILKVTNREMTTQTDPDVLGSKFCSWFTHVASSA